jgi:hypothetical protein
MKLSSFLSGLACFAAVTLWAAAAFADGSGPDPCPNQCTRFEDCTIDGTGGDGPCANRFDPLHDHPDPNYTYYQKLACEGGSSYYEYNQGNFSVYTFNNPNPGDNSDAQNHFVRDTSTDWCSHSWYCTYELTGCTAHQNPTNDHMRHVTDNCGNGS